MLQWPVCNRSKPIKANQNRDLRTIRSLKSRLLRDQCVAGACFFCSVAQSMHAIGSDDPLADASLRAKAIAVYRETCGLSVEDAALTVNRFLQRGHGVPGPKAVYPSTFVRYLYEK